MALQELRIEGTRCLLDFQGFRQPLGIELAPALSSVPAAPRVFTLAPWTYRRHIETLRASTVAAGQALQLDRGRLCEAVLAGLDLDDAARRALETVALWWAAGGDDALPRQPREGEWLALGEGARARLHPWSEGQRLAALNASLSDDGDAAWFDPVGYLDRMVRASLLVLDAPTGLDDLDARATAILLDATVALNLPDADDDLLLQGGPAAREGAARTLSLCRALGWTPARVWATPAAEVERLLRLLALLQPPARPPAARRGSLADHPDATVIRFEDDVA